MNLLSEKTLKDRHFILPRWIKYILSAALLVGAIMCVILFYMFITGATTASPKDLGLVTIFIFIVTILGIAWVPWDKLGLKIKKIGVVEFEDIVTTQHTEHKDDIANLYKRIKELEQINTNMASRCKEHKLALDHASCPVGKCTSEDEINVLLMQFLTKWPKHKFSSTRILNWGSKQPGFADITKYDITVIRCALHDMVKQKKLKTSISEQGNTLYQIR